MKSTCNIRKRLKEIKLKQIKELVKRRLKLLRNYLKKLNSDFVI